MTDIVRYRLPFGTLGGMVNPETRPIVRPTGRVSFVFAALIFLDEFGDKVCTPLGTVEYSQILAAG